MRETLDECRWLYNFLLEQRKNAWEDTQQSLTLYKQQEQFATLKESRESLKTVHSQVLQNVAVRLDLAFKAFFRRLKSGEKPGYPRFQGWDRYDSFCYPQSGFSIVDGRLRLSKIGDVKIILHRPMIGTIKTVCVRRQAGHWHACFSVEYDAVALPENSDAVGIDVGLKDFAFLSTGEAIENPKFYRRDESDMKRVQRRVSRADKGSHARRKAKKALCKVHQRIANRRNDFAHQHSRRIVNRFGLICVEDIAVNRMVHNHCLAKSIMDAAWSKFFDFLTYKAECAGRQVIKVNPAYTSQDCSQCGHRQKMPLSERWYNCPCCGLSIGRDHNASLNILALGQQCMAASAA